MQILILEIDRSIKLFNLIEKKGSFKFESLEELQDANKINFSNETECIIIDPTAPDEPRLSLLINKLIASDYKITTNNVPNAIKKINMDEFIKIIKSKKRSNAGFSVPPNALFLKNIKYHKSIFIK